MMTNKMIHGHWSLFLLLFATSISATSAFFFPKHATIDPEDSSMLIGESLSVTCNLTSSSQGKVNVSDMFFRLEFKDSQPLNYEPSERSDIGIRAVIPIPSNAFKHMTLSCRQKQESNGTSKFLHSTFVYAEYPPRNITDVKILYQNFAYLNISWSLGKYLDEKNTISVETSWEPTSPNFDTGNKCTISSSTTCKIRTGSQNRFYVKVKVTYSKAAPDRDRYVVNPQPLSVTTDLDINPWQYLKPGTPRDLIGGSLNSTCVTLNWTEPYYFSDWSRGSFYEVTAQWQGLMANVKVEDGSSIPLQVSTTGIRPYQDRGEPIDVCGLHPYSRYVLTVRVKDEKQGFFSDAASTTASTEAGKPARGPSVVAVSFEPCYNQADCRDIRVYFNPLARSLWNGAPLYYQVSSVPDSETSETQPVKLDPSTNYFSQRLTGMSDNVTYSYVFDAVNEVSGAARPIEVTIPSVENTVKVPASLGVRVEESASSTQKNLTVHWNSSVVAEMGMSEATLTFYNCMESNPLTCFGYLAKQSTSTQAGIIETFPVFPNQTLFGYSIDYGEKSTGVQWTDCVYNRMTKPGKVETLQAVTGKVRNSIDVKWSAAQCDKSHKYYITQNLLYLCDSKKFSNSCAFISLEPSVTSHTFTGLTKGHTYYMYIQSYSLAGEGPLSDAVNAVPTNSDLELNEIMGIVMGAIAAILILVVFLVCCYRACRRSRHRIVEEMKSHSNKEVSGHNAINFTRLENPGLPSPTRPRLSALPEPPVTVGSPQPILTPPASAVPPEQRRPPPSSTIPPQPRQPFTPAAAAKDIIPNVNGIQVDKIASPKVVGPSSANHTRPDSDSVNKHTEPKQLPQASNTEANQSGSASSSSGSTDPNYPAGYCSMVAETGSVDSDRERQLPLGFVSRVDGYSVLKDLEGKPVSVEAHPEILEETSSLSSSSLVKDDLDSYQKFEPMDLGSDHSDSGPIQVVPTSGSDQLDSYLKQSEANSSSNISDTGPKQVEPKLDEQDDEGFSSPTTNGETPGFPATSPKTRGPQEWMSFNVLADIIPNFMPLFQSDLAQPASKYTSQLPVLPVTPGHTSLYNPSSQPIANNISNSAGLEDTLTLSEVMDETSFSELPLNHLCPNDSSHLSLNNTNGKHYIFDLSRLHANSDVENHSIGTDSSDYRLVGMTGLSQSSDLIEDEPHSIGTESAGYQPVAMAGLSQSSDSIEDGPHSDLMSVLATSPTKNTTSLLADNILNRSGCHAEAKGLTNQESFFNPIFKPAQNGTDLVESAKSEPLNPKSTEPRNKSDGYTSLEFFSNPKAELKQSQDRTNPADELKWDDASPVKSQNNASSTDTNHKVVRLDDLISSKDLAAVLNEYKQSPSDKPIDGNVSTAEHEMENSVSDQPMTNGVTSSEDSAQAMRARDTSPSESTKSSDSGYTSIPEPPIKDQCVSQKELDEPIKSVHPSGFDCEEPINNGYTGVKEFEQLTRNQGAVDHPVNKPLENGYLPVESANRPLENGYVPVESANRPLEDGYVPVEFANNPMKNGYLPVDFATKQVKNGYVPVESANRPLENGYVPVESANRPLEDGYVPVEFANNPMKNGYLPVDFATKQVKNGYVPVESANRPLENGYVPVESANRPLEDGYVPVEFANNSMKNGYLPVDFATKQVKNGYVPVESANRPLENGYVPVEYANRPLENGYVPVEYAKRSEFTKL